MKFYKIVYKRTFWKCDLWLAKSRVSIAVWKTWKGSRHYTPSFRHVFVSYAVYFIKEVENISPRIETLVEVWENSKLRWKNLPYGLVYPLQFLVRLNLNSCLLHSIKLRKCFLFLKYNYWNIAIAVQSRHSGSRVV